MTYIQLYKLNLKNQLTEALGSDSYIPMDGRLSVDSIRVWADSQSFSKQVVAYQVRKSIGRGLSDYRAVSPIIMVD
jgi:hypothetical protein